MYYRFTIYKYLFRILKNEKKLCLTYEMKKCFLKIIINIYHIILFYVILYGRRAGKKCICKVISFIENSETYKWD